MHRPAERSIAVVIPSRLAAGAGRRFFVERAIEAAVTQAIPRGFRLAFFIGIDLDAQIPSALGARPDVTFARSHGRSQASAINAAANAAAVQNHDFIALLEDDDQWEPNFLAWALPCLESCDFVSSKSARGRCRGALCPGQRFSNAFGLDHGGRSLAQGGAVRQIFALARGQ